MASTDSLVNQLQQFTKAIYKCALLFVFLCANTESVYANPSNVLNVNTSLFSLPKNLAKRTYFWENIFLKYPSTTHVIHDANEPWLIIDVIPYDKLAQKRNKPNLITNKDKRVRVTEKYIDRYRLAIKRFATLGKKAVSIGPMEKRIYTVYKQTNLGLNNLLRGRVKVRYQQGLSDTFIQAAKRAQDYLPYIEREFRNYGVPIEISRLAFVESMFNSKAVSKVGASGMWQFMRSTAKSYMRVNSKLDERNSPLKAARAAAKLLSDNYQALGRWDLAITAYNHGRAGMINATKTVGSKNLGTIIKKYKKRSFGFASKNFYTEFLAALRSYNYLIKSNKINITPSKIDVVSVNLQKPIRVRDLSSTLRVPLTEIKKHNSCINSKTYSKHNYYRLPKNYELFIPRRYTRSLNRTVASVKNVRSRG